MTVSRTSALFRPLPPIRLVLGRVVASLLTLSLVVGISACQKKEEGAETKSTGGGLVTKATVLDAPILKRLPQNTLGFAVWREDTPAAERSRLAGGLSRESFTQKLVELSAGGRAEALAPVMTSLKKSALLNPPQNGKSSVREGMAFLTLDPAKKSGAGALVVSGAEGVDLSGELGVMREAFTQQGITPASESFNGVSGFSVDIKALAAQVKEQQGQGAEDGEQQDEDAPPAKKGKAAKKAPAAAKTELEDLPIERMYVGATKDLFVVGTTPEIVGQAFGTQNGEGLKALMSAPSFERAKKLVPPSDDHINYVYVDLAQALTQIDALIPAEQRQGDTKLADLPLEAIAGGTKMEKNREVNFVLAMNPKTEEQKKFAKLFDNAGKVLPTLPLPESGAFTVAVDGQLITNLKDSIVSQLPPEQQQPAQASFAPLQGIQSLSISIRSPAQASPFPELIVASQMENPQPLTSLVIAQARALTAGGGMPVSPLQEKNISGVKVSYVMSPLGVGAFFAQLEKGVVLATSESAIADFIKTSQTRANTFNQMLPESAKQMLQGKAPLVVSAIDFGRIATLLSSVKDTVAMFSGGQSNIDQAQLDELRSMGSVYSMVGFRDNAFELMSVTEPAHPPGTHP